MIFAPTNPEKVAAQQLYEARRLWLEHQAAAEYHQAMAEMCAKRVLRLKTDQPTQEPQS